MAPNPDTEPFPSIDSNPPQRPDADPSSPRHRTTSRGSSIAGVVRRLSRDFENSRPPEGFVAATSEIASTIAAERPRTQAMGNSTGEQLETAVTTVEKRRQSAGSNPPLASSTNTTDTVVVPAERADDDATAPFENGYHFPPNYPFLESTQQALAAFWKFFTTPMGFFWTIYGLNVVAWGGMLFLLLCNASPAMCHPTCDDINSPRRKWIEWDSQILTALFCVPAFGLAPWRFRDLWFELKYRLKGDHSALQRLAGIHSSWFRLQGSQHLPSDVGPDNIPDETPLECVPLPVKNMAPAPLTGVRAPATAVWKLDFAIQCMVWNTLGQCALCGIMWGMNRYDRPSWTTGFLVAITCVIAMVGGWVMFVEGKKVKGIEGVPLTPRDLERLERDKELGILHYNNLKDKKPKAKKGDPEK